MPIIHTITDSQKMGIKFIRRPDLNSSQRGGKYVNIQ